MMHEQVHCCDEAANYQLPIAANFWIIWMMSFCGGMFKLNEKFDADSLLYLLNLNVRPLSTHAHSTAPTD